MAKTAITVRSQHEGDAVKLALDHPALKAASVITGLLLQLPPELRPQVMHIVEAQLLLSACSLDGDVPPAFTRDDEPLRLLDGSASSGAGE
jgi:hypothetical protein